MGFDLTSKKYVLNSTAGPSLFSLRLLGFCWHKGISWRSGLCSWEAHHQQNFIALIVSKNLEPQIFHLEIVLTFDLSLPTFLFSFLTYCLRCKPEL